MTPVASSENQTELLLHAFRSFNEASNSLRTAYTELHGRVTHISEELEQTNYYLTTVLQSLPCGVVVVSRQSQVTLINQLGREFFGLPDLEPPFPLATLLKSASFTERAATMREEGAASTEIRVGEPERTLHCCWSPLRGNERILVVQDVTHIRRLERQMREAEKVAAMGEMALEVAHEIRNPLGALELFASLLGEEDLSPQDQRRYLANMQIGIRSLNTVLTNMLCFRKSPELAVSSFQLGSVLSEVSSLLQPLLEQRSIEVVASLKDKSQVRLDREMLHQIFTNLITNAIQALPEGGRLALATWESDGQVYARVRDTGTGIPQQYQELIFESGYSTHPSGTGLGLAIVRRLLNRLGGSIDVASEQGEGTEFTLCFPARG